MAQRIIKHGYHLGVVVSVLPSTQAKVAAAEAYNTLGLPSDPSTIDCITELADGLAFEVVYDCICTGIVNMVEM